MSLLISLFVHHGAWHRKSDKLVPHFTMQSVQAGEAFIKSTEQPQSTVTVMHYTIKLKFIRHNRDIIRAVAIYCGRQCIGERGISQPTWKPWKFFSTDETTRKV